ncbi:hypothetical protein, partial [Vibrio cholerae]|uniref:hypothetical protein n=1 Tax=Vibrio cholerae TaxID=666 RepID=UPI0030809F5B
MVSVVVFEFSGMCCQPLRRALAIYEEILVGGVSGKSEYFYFFASFVCFGVDCMVYLFSPR